MSTSRVYLSMGNPQPGLNPFLTSENTKLGGLVMQNANEQQDRNDADKKYWEGALPATYNQMGQDQFNSMRNSAVANRAANAKALQDQAMAHYQLLVKQWNTLGANHPETQATLRNYNQALDAANQQLGQSQEMNAITERNPQYGAPSLPQYSSPQVAQGPWRPNNAPEPMPGMPYDPNDPMHHAHGTPNEPTYPHIINDRGSTPFPTYGISPPMTTGGYAPPSYNYLQGMYNGMKP